MIIGIIGKKGVGKDTLCDYLVNRYNLEKYSFADPLKRTLIEMFCLKKEQVYEQELKEVIDPRWGISPREMMQIFGTNIIQNNINNFFPNLKTEPRLFWVEHFINSYKERMITDPNLKIIISDVRFLHEAKAVKEIGGKLIRIIRSTSDDSNLNSDPDQIRFQQHSSETELDDLEEGWIDDIIDNNTNLEELYQKGSNVIEKIKQL